MDFKLKPVKEELSAERYPSKEESFDPPARPSEPAENFKEEISSIASESVSKHSTADKDTAVIVCSLKGEDYQDEREFPSPQNLPESEMNIKTEPVDDEDSAARCKSNEDWFKVPVVPSGLTEYFKDIHSIKTEDASENSTTKEKVIFRSVKDENFQDVGECSSMDENKFLPTVPTTAKRELPLSKASAACLSLTTHQNGIAKQNMNRTKELVAVIVLEQRTFRGRSFVCCVCFDIFASQRLLRNHNLSHKADTNVTQASGDSSKRDDYAVQAFDRKLIECDQCSFKTARLSHLTKHKMIHSGEKPFKCDQCSFKTARVAYLNQHKIIHSGEKPFKCDQCSFKTAQSHYLKEHKMKHSGEKPFSCDECNFKTAHLTYLKQHKMKHSGKKPYKCDQCSFETARLSHLKQHKMIHSGEKPFKCDQCSFNTAQLANFNQHKMTHSGEKPFGCDQCSFKTSLLSYLKRHKVKHTRRKPILCDS